MPTCLFWPLEVKQAINVRSLYSSLAKVSLHQEQVFDCTFTEDKDMDNGKYE